MWTIDPCSYPACACAKGLSNWFCPSVSLFVSLSGEDRKWALCMHTMCVHTPHTHTHIQRTAKLSDQTHKNWMQNPSMPSIGQLHSKANTTHLRWNCITSIAANNFQPTFIQPLRLLVMDLGWPTGSPPLHLSICVPTYMHNTRAHSCTQPNKQVGWIPQASKGLH